MRKKVQKKRKGRSPSKKLKVSKVRKIKKWLLSRKKKGNSKIKRKNK